MNLFFRLFLSLFAMLVLVTPLQALAPSSPAPNTSNSTLKPSEIFCAKNPLNDQEIYFFNFYQITRDPALYESITEQLQKQVDWICYLHLPPEIVTFFES